MGSGKSEVRGKASRSDLQEAKGNTKSQRRKQQESNHKNQKENTKNKAESLQ
jgi:hypothetical protein